MAELLTVAGAQMGPISKDEGRAGPVHRMVRLIELAHRRGAKVVVFPELCLTTFFPRWFYEAIDQVDHWFESAMPSDATAPIFAAAKQYKMTVEFGFAELVHTEHEDGARRIQRFNTCVLVSPDGHVMLKYRKIHLPGHADFIPARKTQHLEKRYFEVGDLGFPVKRVPIEGFGDINAGMLICNDRRWPEAWRVLGLQDVELVMIGYNTPVVNLDNSHFQPPHLKVFHSTLSVQAGCYQNSCFAVSVAKAGDEDGNELFGSSVIVNPFGEVVAQTSGWGDELIVADCDLDLCKVNRASTFNFGQHRRPEFYQRLLDQVGSEAPERWTPPAA